MRTDVELTIRGDDVRSDRSSDTIELSPQVTVRGPVTGSTEPPAMASTSYFNLSRAPSGPSMAVTSRWIDEQPIRSAFSATGLPTVAYDRSVSPNSLRCDEEVTRISASVASPPRPRTSSAPDSPSRCDVNVSMGDHSIVHPLRLSVLGLMFRLTCRRVHSPVHPHRCQALM